jgi:hypothetical protein
MARLQRHNPAALNNDDEEEDADEEDEELEDEDEEDEGPIALSSSDLPAEGIALPEGGSATGAPLPGMRMKPEKKMVIPRKKVTTVLRRDENTAPFVMSAEDVETMVPGVSLSLTDGETPEGVTVPADDTKLA